MDASSMIESIIGKSEPIRSHAGKQAVTSLSHSRMGPTQNNSGHTENTNLGQAVSPNKIQGLYICSMKIIFYHQFISG